MLLIYLFFYCQFSTPFRVLIQPLKFSSNLLNIFSNINVDKYTIRPKKKQELYSNVNVDENLHPYINY